MGISRFLDDLIREKVVVRSDFRPLISLFRECTPRLLVVTDGLSYSVDSDFGLTQFVETLRSSTIHAMTPEVLIATHNPAPAAVISFDPALNHISNFKFDDATHGVLKSRYDVVFILGINREGSNDLTPGGLSAISKFMEDGGGVFATGDHEDLGAAMARSIPRVRNMRFWRMAETPNVANTKRLSTNIPGGNGLYEFEDQADAFPQRLYVNYRTVAGGVGNPHPLLQIPATSRAIEVFPDHPHEGECRVPTDLTTTFPLNGANVAEWPNATAGGSLRPELVALTMSHGNSFPGKEALVPRSFIAICAYDGQAANVGRVVTDATWHHFVNINIQRTSPPAPVGQTGLAGTDLQDVKQYFVNLATWLMPKNTRRCLRFPVIIRELQRFPLFEELRLPPLEEAGGRELRDIGEQVQVALEQRLTRAQVDELLADALEEGLGVEAAAKLQAHGKRFGALSAADAGLAALGAVTIATAATLLKVADKKEIEPHTTFGPTATEAAGVGVKRYLEAARQDLRRLDEELAAAFL